MEEEDGSIGRDLAAVAPVPISWISLRNQLSESVVEEDCSGGRWNICKSLEVEMLIRAGAVEVLLLVLRTGVCSWWPVSTVTCFWKFCKAVLDAWLSNIPAELSSWLWTRDWLQHPLHGDNFCRRTNAEQRWTISMSWISPWWQGFHTKLAYSSSHTQAMDWPSSGTWCRHSPVYTTCRFSDYYK